jgi:ketosteroid isomerase-like protein
MTKVRQAYFGTGIGLLPILAVIFLGGYVMAENVNVERDNKALVRASFERWQKGTGSPFEMLDPAAEWTVTGSSPLSKTYPTRQAFMDSVITPFNARLSAPLVPSVRGIYADGDMVVVLFDARATAKDGRPYRNTYTWYLKMRDAKAIQVIAFFDTREFDDLWSRVAPSEH